MQSVFGPGHIIQDIDSAREMLRVEVERVSKLAKAPYAITPCDAFYPFARYPVQMTIEGEIAFDDYFSVFIKSSEFKTDISEKDFVLYWEEVLPYLKTKELVGFDEDSKYITTLFADREYLVRHSEVYREKYQPAYRVINMEYIWH
jgi:hypothetical protein